VKATLSRSVAIATLAGVGVAAAFAGASLRDRPRVPAGLPGLAGIPETLRETGLFSPAAHLLAYTPQYPLWSDGATKRRWIYLPPGRSIDASNPDAWQFPIGTRVWKEFAFHGAKVETRFMMRTAAGWQYATYIWNADDSEAVRAPAQGATSVQLAPGIKHRIPSEADCRACHASGPTPVLGFSALQLSSDRDPNAPHRETPATGSVELPELVAEGLVTGLPASVLATAPRIPGSPTERAALGYLHGNCGGCHRSDGPVGSVGMELAVSVVSPGGAQRTAVGVASHFMAPAARIVPGDHAASVIYRRMATRNPIEQMPALGTLLVDTEATQLIADWIDQLAHKEED
jgi:hypothetical protein